MKLLVAIKVNKGTKRIDEVLRWVARSGYDIKIFVKRWQRRRFKRLIDDANYNWYLALTPDIIVSKGADIDLLKYAKEHDYELVLELPDDLYAWNKQLNTAKQVLQFAGDTGKARLAFSTRPRMKIKRWHNGAVMRRV